MRLNSIRNMRPRTSGMRSSLGWQGRFDEAFAESKLARQLDPLSSIIASDYASILYESRQYDNAIQQYRSVLELDPNFEHARYGMIPSLLQLGKYDEAMELTKRWAGEGNNPWALAWEATIYGRWGDAEEASRALAKLERVAGSRTDRIPTLLLAYAGSGQKERVIELLHKAYTEHSNAAVQIKVDPMYDAIRNDPRFQDLLRRLGLGP